MTSADWRAAAFATGPGDAGRVRDGLRDAYAAAGLTVPGQVVWVPSPLHGAVAAVLAADPGARGTLLDAGLGREADLAAAELAGCGQPGRLVRDLVRTAPWKEARSAASARLGAAGWARACARYADLQDQTGTLVTAIRRSLGVLGTGPGGDSEPDADAAGPLLRRATLDAVLGQHDAAWLAVFADLGQLGELPGLAAVAMEAGWWWPYENLVIVSARPEQIHRDDTGRLHRGDGPALAYGGGFELNAWRGLPLPPGFLESLADGPEARERIMTEENAELRRVMLECYGFERYLADTGAQPVGRDPAGVLWRIDLAGDEPVVMVEVVNSTPEPDGTHRTYWLRVPPDTRTAWQGVAWTFGLTGKEYQPEKQT